MIHRLVAPGTPSGAARRIPGAVPILLALVLGAALPARPPAPPAARALPAPAAAEQPATPAPGPARAPIYLPLAGMYTRSDLVEAAELPADGWVFHGRTGQVADLAVDVRRGLLWAATEGGLLRWHPEDGSRLRLGHRPVAHLALARDGRVWFGGGDPDGLAAGLPALQVLDAATWPPRPVADLPEGELTALAPDPAGGVWAAFAGQRQPDGSAAGGGLLRIAADGSRRSFGPAEGLSGAGSRAIAADGAGGAWLALGPAGDDPPTGVAHLAADGSLRVEGPAEGLTEPDVIALAAGPAGTLLALARRADGSTNALFERGPDGRWRQPALPRELAERMRFHHDDVDAFELRRIAIDAEGGWWLLAPGAVLRRTPDGVWDLLPRADEALAPAIEDGLWRALYTGSGAFATGADGTLWLGDPDGGLLRWARAAGWSRQVGDGDLPLRAANSLSVDRAGRPWLVGGRAWQLGRDARWRALEDPLDLDDLRCQDGDETAVVVARGPDGRLWIGDRGAVWQLAPDGTRLGRGSAAGLDVGRVLAIAFAPDGSAWVGGSEGLARQRPGGGWQTFGPRDGLPPGSVATLAFDARGQIWAGTRPDWRWDAAADGCVARGRGGLVTLPPGGGWTELALPPGLVEAAGDTINALLPDPQGGLLAAIGPRLYRRGPEGVWADRTAAVGLAARWPLRALAHDGAGNLWIGSDGDGARRVRPDGSWDAFGAGGGKLGDSVVALQAGPDGSMWFGLAYGGIDGARLARRRPDGSWTAYRQGWDAFWAHEIVSIALDDAGRIWCGTGQGRLYRLDEAEGFRVLVLHDALGQAEGSLFRLAPGEDGALWLASSEGLLRRDERGRLRTWQGADGLPSGVVSAVLPRPEGGAWAGFGWGTGAWRLEEGGGIGFVDAAGRYQDESEASGLADLQVGDLALGPGGRLLAALHAPRLRNERVSSLTGAGLALRDAAGDWRRVDRAAGLPSDELRAVAITPDGWLWAATDRGLAQSRDGAAWVTPGPAEGLSVTDVRALAVDADGSLWAGGADGLARREAVGRWRMLRRLGQPPEAVVDLALDPGGNAWLLVEQGPQRRSIAVRLRGAADRP